MDVDEFVEQLKQRDVLMLPEGPGLMRAVPNLMVDAEMIQTTLGHIREIVAG